MKFIENSILYLIQFFYINITLFLCFILFYKVNIFFIGPLLAIFVFPIGSAVIIAKTVPKIVIKTGLDIDEEKFGIPIVVSSLFIWLFIVSGIYFNVPDFFKVYYGKKYNKLRISDIKTSKNGTFYGFENVKVQTENLVYSTSVSSVKSGSNYTKITHNHFLVPAVDRTKRGKPSLFLYFNTTNTKSRSTNYPDLKDYKTIDKINGVGLVGPVERKHTAKTLNYLKKSVEIGNDILIIKPTKSYDYYVKTKGKNVFIIFLVANILFIFLPLFIHLILMLKENNK